jgi:hypothetical protein
MEGWTSILGLAAVDGATMEGWTSIWVWDIGRLTDIGTTRVR